MAQKSFAVILQEWRLGRQLNQAQAAHVLCDMPLGTLQRYEQGTREPAPWVKALLRGHMARFATPRK